MATKKGKQLTLPLSLIVMAVLAVTAWRSWPHIQFWWRFEALGKNAQAYPEYRHRKTGIVFVKLPGGKFLMGAQENDPEGRNYNPEAFSNQGPVHQVTLSPFLIAKYELTQGQWIAVMGSNPSIFNGNNKRPVERVSWDDIQEFETKTGLTLPTEAQWEYACGVDIPGLNTGDIDELAWYLKNSGEKTHPVGEKQPNQYGLYDIHGNISEWCEDVYDEDFYSKPESSGPDPISTSGSEMRIVRGGSWYDENAWSCRPTFRSPNGTFVADFSIGFRPCYRLSQ